MADNRINTEEFVASFLADTNNIVDVSNESGNELLEKLHEEIQLVGEGLEDADNADILEQLRTDVQEVGTHLGESLDDLIQSSRAYAEAAIEMGANRAFGASAGETSTTGSFKTNDLLNGLLQVQKAMFSEFKSQNTMWVGISKFGQQAQNQLSNIIANAIQGNQTPTITNNTMGGNPAGTLPVVLAGTPVGNAVQMAQSAAMPMPMPAGGGVGGGTPGANTNAAGMPGGAGGLNRAAAGMIAATVAMELLARKSMELVGALGVDLSTMWKGVIADQAVFQRNMRNMMFTTQGFVAANRELEASYMDITNAVSATGMKRVAFQKEWMKVMQRGFKISTRDAKLEKDRFKLRERAVKSSKAVVTSAMATAKQLDIAEGSVGNMVSMMGDWAFHLGMSEFSIANMGREMQRIARSTGVTGEKLMSAIKASNKFMEMMRSSANLTEKASTNIMALTTSLEKRGVLEKFGAELQGLSSRTQFFQIDDKTRNFLTQMAAGAGGSAMNNLLFGKTMQSEENIAQLQGGLGPVLQRYLGQAAKDVGFAEGVTTDNLSEVIEKLTNAGVDLSIIDQQMFAAFGKGLGDIERFNEGLNEAKESMRPVGVQMDELAKKIAVEEAAGRGMLDATNELRSRFEELRTDSVTRAFSALQAQSEQGFGAEELKKRLSDVFGRTEQGQTNVSDFMADPQSFAQPLIQSLETRAAGLDKNLSDILSKRGFTTDSLSKDLAAGGDRQVAALRALQEAQNELGTLEKDAQDPINAIQRDLSEINNKLGGWFGGLLASLSKGNLVGIILAALSMAVGANILMGGRVIQLLSSLTGGRGLLGLGRGAQTAANAGRSAQAASAATRGQAVVGRGLNAAGRVTGAGTNPFATMGGSMGNAARTTQTARVASTGVRGFTTALSKAMGPLTLAIGGLTGVMEANEAGMKKQTGALVGALTGGAKTGSMFSSSLGVEKGSRADKTLGVAGGAAWGAAAGAAIGSAFFGVGAAPGALIGAIVGGITEIIKIITDGTRLLDDLVGGLLYVAMPIYPILEAAWYMLKGIWKTIKGIFTLDFGQVLEGIWDVLWAIPKTILNMVGAVIKMVIAIPQILWRGLKMAAALIWDVITSLPGQIISAVKYIAGTIKDGLGAAFGQIASLAYTALKGVFVDFPIWLGGALLSGLKAVFIDFPIWLGGALLTGLQAVFIDFPMWLLGSLMDGLKAVFVDFPSWIGSQIQAGFNALLANEWIAPIIDPFYEIWQELSSIVSDIAAPFQEAGAIIGEAFAELKTAFEPITTLFTDIKESLFGPSDAEGFSFLSAAMSVLGTVLKGLAHTVGFVLKVALFPLKLALQGLGLVVKGVMMVVGPVVKFFAGFIRGIVDGFKALVDGIVAPFRWLYDVLVGHSIVPDLVTEIIKLFATLPLQIPKLIFNMISGITGYIGGLADKVGGPLGVVLKGLLKPFKLISEFAKAAAEAISGIIEGLWETLGGLADVIAGIFTLDFTRIKDGLWSVFSGIGGAFKSAFLDLPKWLAGKFIDGLKAIFIDFPSWLLGKMKDGLVGIGEALLDGVKAVFVDFPVMIYNGFKDALSSVWEWIKSWVPGAEAIGNVAGGFSETNEEASARIAKEGSSFTRGMGRTAGGVADIFTGGEDGLFSVSGRLKGAGKSSWRSLGSHKRWRWCCMGWCQVSRQFPQSICRRLS